MRKKYKHGKCNMSIKVGNTGCTVLTISYENFHEKYVGMSDHYYSHFMRRIEDIGIAAQALVLVTRLLRRNALDAVSRKKPGFFSGVENEASTSVAEELLRMKNLNFGNPQAKEEAAFDVAPVIRLRVIHRPLKKSLLDCTIEELSAHFNVVRNEDVCQDERVEYDDGTEKNEVGAEGWSSQQGQEYCIMEMRHN